MSEGVGSAVRRRGHRPRVTAAGVVVLAALAPVLAACGGDDATDATDEADDPGSSSTTPASSLPACAETWVADADLPKAYQGCFDGSNEIEPTTLRCGSGQVIVTFDDRFWAVPGARVNETDGLDEDRGFKAAKQTCLA